jgi:hypothetical protein
LTLVRSAAQKRTRQDPAEETESSRQEGAELLFVVYLVLQTHTHKPVTYTLAVFLPPSSYSVVPCYALLCPNRLGSEFDDGVDDVACEPRVDPSIHPNNDDDEDKNYHSSMGVIVGIANGTVQHVSDRESECLRRMFYG